MAEARGTSVIHRHLLETLGIPAERLGVRLSDDAASGTIDARRLIETTVLRTLLSEHAARWPDGDARAAASVWTKAYFRTLIPSVIVPVVAGVPLDASAASCTLMLEGPVPTAVAVKTLSGPWDLPGPPTGPAALRSYGGLLSDHVAPLAFAIRDLTGLSPRVVWSNAGNLIAYLYRELASLPGLSFVARAHNDHVLGMRHTPWFPKGNPLFDPVRMIRVTSGNRTADIHCRRVCCLRDRLGDTLCTSCPRLSDADRRALVDRLSTDRSTAG